MSELEQALEDSRPAIEAGLADAERELEDLDARRLELEVLIARARAALGDPDTRFLGSRSRMTLHEAMDLVLTENGNRWMTVRELADEINDRSLYEKRDGSPVEPSQIHARANKYAERFEKDGACVRNAARDS